MKKVHDRAVLAGIFISLQSVFNTKVSAKIGLWETNTIVHGLGFAVSLALLLIFRDSGLQKINEVNKVYLLGGAFGVLIIYSIMKSFSLLGAAYSVSILLISQLMIALAIDSFGLFGVEKIPFTGNKAIGIGVMVIGILIFKLR
jgi:transporter family-2 protein